MGWRGGITLHLQVGGIWGPVEDSVTSDGGGGEEEKAIAESALCLDSAVVEIGRMQQIEPLMVN